MSGWPSRVIRSLFGPRLQDAYPVQNPEFDIPASAHNVAFHQIAGLNVMLPRACVVAQFAAGWLIDYQQEVWNPSGSQAHPVLARVGAGHYTLTFASSYLDEAGNAVPTALVFARAGAMAEMVVYADRVDAYAWIENANPLVAHVYLFDAAGNFYDAPFWLEVG